MFSTTEINTVILWIDTFIYNSTCSIKILRLLTRCRMTHVDVATDIYIQCHRYLAKYQSQNHSRHVNNKSINVYIKSS